MTYPYYTLTRDYFAEPKPGAPQPGVRARVRKSLLQAGQMLMRLSDPDVTPGLFCLVDAQLRPQLDRQVFVDREAVTAVRFAQPHVRDQTNPFTTPV